MENEFLLERGKKKWIEQHALFRRDLVFENAIVTMVLCIVYHIYDDNISNGRTGMGEKDQELLTLIYAGAKGKPKYALMFMEIMVDKSAL